MLVLVNGLRKERECIYTLLFSESEYGIQARKSYNQDDEAKSCYRGKHHRADGGGGCGGGKPWAGPNIFGQYGDADEYRDRRRDDDRERDGSDSAGGICDHDDANDQRDDYRMDDDHDDNDDDNVALDS